MAELEDEARFKLAIAETCGVSPTMIRKETGGQDTIDKRADKMTLIPEYIFAMDRAIKTILMEKDEDDAFEGKTWIHEENVHHKTRTKVRYTGANTTEHGATGDIAFPTGILLINLKKY